MTPRTYGISPVRRNVLIGVWLILTLPLAIAGVWLPDPGLLASALLISVILVPIFALAVRAARLHVSDDGIELRQLGMRVAAPWDNIAGVRTVRGREGIVLHRPLEGKGAARMAASAAIRFRGASIYDATQQQLIAEHRFIPIEAFAHWLEHGDLRQALQARLSGAAGFDPSDQPAPDRLTRGRLSLVVAIIAAALAAGFALALASPETQARIERILAIPVGFAMLAYAIGNGVAAVRYLKHGSVGWFLLWASMAVVQTLIGIAIWSAAL
ncbi:MAG: PH domain-containing protein [Acidobacteria bacterium]|nr:PH domain-containing protein [Acidobacteriota bacterium]